MIKTTLKELRKKRSEGIAFNRAEALYFKYKDFTMVPKSSYIKNILLSEKFFNLPGDIVECGVWKGGVVAGIAESAGNKRTHLFDSFQGLPAAEDRDGVKAKLWQENNEGEFYFDNCSAEIQFAKEAMDLSGVKYFLYPGWFEETLNDSVSIDQISILRLDVDWYKSTMECLEFLYPKVSKGGLILIDDYYTWEGCSKAIHDYLSKSNSISRIRTFRDTVAYIIKEDD